MNTDDDLDAIAKLHIVQKYGVEHPFTQRRLWGDPDGIYYDVNRRHESGMAMFVGGAGFFVLRATGEIWTFGAMHAAAKGLDYLITLYGEWRPGIHRLTVRSVADAEAFANLLVSVGIEYVLREVEYGTVRESSHRAEAAMVIERLSRTPCTFLFGPEDARAVARALRERRIADVDFEFMGYPPRRDSRAESNSPEQLGVWWDAP